MEYTVSNTINQSLDVVVKKFTEPNGALEWMEGMQRIDRISGEPYTVGAKADFHSVYKNKEMKISEEVLEQNLPNSIKFGYQSSMGYNEVEMRFEDIDGKSVKQINRSRFEMKGFAKIMGFLFKGMFKKQSLKYMDAFKAYAEKS